MPLECMGTAVEVFLLILQSLPASYFSLWLMDVPIYTWQLQYPEQLSSGTILQTYLRGEALLSQDIWSYMSAIREERSEKTPAGRLYQRLRVTVAQAQSLAGISLIKLGDILDANKYWGKQAEVIGMFWRVVALEEALENIRNVGLEANLVTETHLHYEAAAVNNLIIAYRWWQWLEQNPEPWLQKLRQGVKRNTVS